MQQTAPAQDETVPVTGAASCSSKDCWIISYLYLVQAVCVSAGFTMPLTYDVLPEYSVLSLWAAGSLPFSFKFLIAPVLERYHFVEYGKRKTWVVASGAAVAAILLLMSRLTDMQHQVHLAVCFFFMVTCISVQGLSLNVLALKELQSPSQVSMIEAVMRPAGRLCGSLIFLKLSSKSFAWNVFGRT